MRALRFRPGVASSTLTILLFPVLVSLGFWQLDRAAQKQQVAAQALANRDAPALQLTNGTALEKPNLRGRAAYATGRYLEPNLLLDNRIRRGLTGYEVLTPFELENGSRILVARGWLAAGAERAQMPMITTPSTKTRLPGRLGKAPVTGIRLGHSDDCEPFGPALVRVQRLDAGIVSKALGYAVPGDVFYLDPAAPNGYDREWPEPASDISKHQAYAVQWFAMAAVLFGLYLKINLQRAPLHDSR